MADTLVERVTGRTAATATPIAVNLVMTGTETADDRYALVEAFSVPNVRARKHPVSTF
jgi:hypothetical protein